MHICFCFSIVCLFVCSFVRSFVRSFVSVLLVGLLVMNIGLNYFCLFVFYCLMIVIIYDCSSLEALNNSDIIIHVVYVYSNNNY